MRPLLVLDLPGLTPSLLGPRTPHLNRIAAEGFRASLRPVLPAVTCPAQSTMLTGIPPRGHGVVGNGWYFRDLSEVLFWRQSNALVGGEKVWEVGRRRDPGFTCAKLFWWFNMYSTADWAVTPRPVYPADGRKLAGFIYASPPDLTLPLYRALGPFPLFQFWGPTAGIRSSDWIAGCAQLVMERHRPTLTLVYLPHLDYDLQRFGPGDPRAADAAAAVDAVAGRLADAARAAGANVIALSEYGITAVAGAVDPNRVLRRAGYLRVHPTPVGELLDAGASRAFAVADHQVAHVYVRAPEDRRAVADLLRGTPGVAEVLEGESLRAAGLDHPRSGEIVALAAKDRWFTYYYWEDDRRAPDFARTVDIHRKPGYDPVELFLDPRSGTKLRILRRLLRKKLGMRYLMDVIPLDSSLVRGSHGRLPDRPEEGPVLLSTSKVGARESLAQADVPGLILETIFS